MSVEGDDLTMDSKLSQIDRLIETGRAFTFKDFCLPRDNEEYGGDDSPDWKVWKTRAYNLVRNAMEESSAPVLLTREAAGTRTEGNYEVNFTLVKSNYLRALELMRAALQDDVFAELRQVASESSSPILSNRVFVVHGHDGELKNSVESFIGQIGLEPIVLHRQPDEGRTIIEKFEHHSDVGYAFILLTPDDVAYARADEALEDSRRTKQYRARQNVVFEFGYFVGRIGRKRVCCLHKGVVELPSDIDGVVYKKVDAGVDSQAFSIIRELKAVGYEVRV